MAFKATEVYAHHKIPLECTIYTGTDIAADAPVALFFHAGALSGWVKDRMPPWLVQACIGRKWPLITADYRLMPQATASDLLQDATAAYEYAQRWNTTGKARRKVIVFGASAGFFLATALTRHVEQPPIALFSISGIPTFQHPFYSSSTNITDKHKTDADFAECDAGPVQTCRITTETTGIFHIGMLLPNGSRNPDFKQPALVVAEEHLDRRGGLMYEHYIRTNKYPGLVQAIDDGFEWAGTDEQKRQLWPPTVIFHGNADIAVPHDISVMMQQKLGKDKVDIFIAEGQDHLFESSLCLEDTELCMDVVRRALARLDEVVAKCKSI